MNIYALLTLCVMQLAPLNPGQAPVLPDGPDSGGTPVAEQEISPEQIDRAFSRFDKENRSREVAPTKLADASVESLANAIQQLAQSISHGQRVQGGGAGPETDSQGKTKEDSDKNKQLDAKEQLAQWYHAVYEFITTQGLKLLFNVIAAVAIFFVGRKLARMATLIISEIMERMGTDPILIKFAANLLYCASLGMVGLASLKMAGVDTDSAIAMIAAAGFAVGLALQGSLANFAAGIMLIVFKPFNVSDEIEAGGETGNVEEVNMFNTILRTNGNVRIIVPNGQVTSGTIKNFTAQRIRLIELKVGCGYCDDLKSVKAFLDKIVRTDTRIVKDPAPAVSVAELGDFSVVFSVKCWVATREYGELRSALLERIKLGFDEEGFTFPYPSRDVYVHQSTAAVTKAA